MAAGAAGAEAGAEVDCSVFSFLLQAASSKRPARASRGRSANRRFFMMCTFLVVLSRNTKTLYFSVIPCRLRLREVRHGQPRRPQPSCWARRCSAAVERPMEAATLRCSSGVSCMM